MKTLPDSPSLDHLRQQAKDLLAQLRMLRPDATLSEAQTVVAEQHGFRTWPDLKAEVDRRYATPRTAEDGVADAVAATFDLGTPQGPLVAFERQWAGQAWVLMTDQGRWIARQLFAWFEETAVKDEMLLAEATVAAGIQTPRPVRSATDNVIETIHGSRWRVFEHLAFGPEPSIPADPRHAATAGRILGSVHRLRLPAPQPIQPWLTQVRSEAQWWQLHAAADADGMPWAGRLAEVIPTIVDVSGIVEVAGPGEDVVLSACHYAPNAFRVAGPDRLVIMGWDHAGAMPVRWDLGATLVAWSGGVDGGVNRAAAKALAAGYAEETEVPGPLVLGSFSTAVCASLNWLGSRIRIALRECDVEAKEIAARAVPTLLAEPPSRNRLQAVLDAID